MRRRSCLSTLLFLAACASRQEADNCALLTDLAEVKEKFTSGLEQTLQALQREQITPGTVYKDKVIGEREINAMLSTAYTADWQDASTIRAMYERMYAVTGERSYHDAAQSLP
jgi:hypothetical protein